MSEHKRHSARQIRRWAIALLALAIFVSSPVSSQDDDVRPGDDMAVEPEQGSQLGSGPMLDEPTSDTAFGAMPLLDHAFLYHGVIYGDSSKSHMHLSDKDNNHHHQPKPHRGESKSKSILDPSIYPPPNKIPNVNSPQVKQWLKEIDWSKVPKIAVAPSVPNVPHFPHCPPDDKVDSRSCWWSCDSCVASDDIITCPRANDWGLTYDDGPSVQTREIMKFLQSSQITATFFIVGSRVLEYPEILNEQVAQGHHLAMHTWSHGGLTTLTNEQIVAEIKWTEKIIRDVTGLTTKYVRPPYGDVDNRVREILRQLGYKTVIWTKGWDTNDWRMLQHQVPESDVVQSFKAVLNSANQVKSQTGHSAGPITLEHDLTPQTISLSKRLIPLGLQHGLRPMNLAACLSDDTPYQRGSKLGPSGAKPKSDNTTEKSPPPSPPPAALPGMTKDDFIPAEAIPAPSDLAGQAKSSSLGMLKRQPLAACLDLVIAAFVGYIIVM